MYFIYIYIFNTSPSYTHAGFIKILMTEMKISANSNLNYKLLFNLYLNRKIIFYYITLFSIFSI